MIIKVCTFILTGEQRTKKIRSISSLLRLTLTRLRLNKILKFYVILRSLFPDEPNFGYFRKRHFYGTIEYVSNRSIPAIVSLLNITQIIDKYTKS